MTNEQALLEAAERLLWFHDQADDGPDFACEADEERFHDGFAEAVEDMRRAVVQATGGPAVPDPNPDPNGWGVPLSPEPPGDLPF